MSQSPDAYTIPLNTHQGRVTDFLTVRRSATNHSLIELWIGWKDDHPHRRDNHVATLSRNAAEALVRDLTYLLAGGGKA